MSVIFYLTMCIKISLRMGSSGDDIAVIVHTIVSTWCWLLILDVSLNYCVSLVSSLQCPYLECV